MTDLDPQEEKFLKPFKQTQGECLAFEGGAVSAVQAENTRCVALLETAAAEAKNIGDRNIEQIYLCAAEKIRIR